MRQAGALRANQRRKCVALAFGHRADGLALGYREQGEDLMEEVGLGYLC
jgi:hypothetical protein